VSGQQHALSALYPRERPGTHITGGWVLLQGRSGRAENLVSTEFRSRTVQPVVSRYTDWATRPTHIYIHAGLHIKYLLFFSDFMQTWIFNRFTADTVISFLNMVALWLKHTDTEQCFAQVSSKKFHANVVLKKAEVEIHPCPEVRKYGSLSASFHRIHLLSKLLWKSPVLNLIQNEQKHVEIWANCHTHKQITAYTALTFMKFTLAQQNYTEIFQLHDSHIIQKCALFGRIAWTSLRKVWQSQCCVFMHGNLCLLGNFL